MVSLKLKMIKFLVRVMQIYQKIKKEPSSFSKYKLVLSKPSFCRKKPQLIIISMESKIIPRFKKITPMV